ncbi:peptidoglycan recognition protein family protein [Collimonas silvisoli]|uniref:peptidoglycan recognition protein family protein n=1 Tax=Collimonas silvisoli TaxID=2825884 RepID=UPI001B8BC731|nr:peptidoglycan recognition family protein [Collimonas silvisoli]
MATVTPEGLLDSPGVISRLFPTIEKGPLKKITGIVVHQTDGPTAQSAFNEYMHGGNGAHFLIDKSGVIYQSASLKKKTWHVGMLKAKCMETYSCSPAELKAGAGNLDKKHKIEMQKTRGERFPSNDDSIGIELVGRAILDPKFIKPGMTREDVNKLRGQKGIFETVTAAQNGALGRLIAELQTVLTIPQDQVYRHPRVSYKNQTEASTAQWLERK